MPCDTERTFGEVTFFSCSSGSLFLFQLVRLSGRLVRAVISSLIVHLWCVTWVQDPPVQWGTQGHVSPITDILLFSRKWEGRQKALPSQRLVLCDNLESMIYFSCLQYICVAKTILSSFSHETDNFLAFQEKGVTGVQRSSWSSSIIQSINTFRVSKWKRCTWLQYSSNRKKNLSQHAVGWSLIFNSVNVY